MRKILAADGDGACFEIEIQNVLNLIGYHAVGLEHEGERTVFVARHLFAAVDAFVKLNIRIAGKLARKREKTGEFIVVVVTLYEIAHRDSPHIHHGVDMLAQKGLIGYVYSVKGLTGGFNADLASDDLFAVIHEREQEQYRLYNALYGEAFIVVACACGAAVAVQNVCAEISHIGVCQFGYVRSKPARARIRPAFLQKLFKQFFHIITSLFISVKVL